MAKKACSLCGEILPFDCFYDDRRMRCGKRSECKKCLLARQKANAETKRSWRAKNQIKNRETHTVHPSVMNPDLRKVCPGCNRDLLAIAFHFARNEASGLQTRCKECARDWRRSESGKQSSKKYASKPHVREAAAKRQSQYNKSGAGKRTKERHAKRHPERVFARRVLQMAVRMGIVAKPWECQACGQNPPPMRDGRSSLQAHHHDYSKPLDVQWLCIPCHKRAGVIPISKGASSVG